jgi:hypothetical protein
VFKTGALHSYGSAAVGIGGKLANLCICCMVKEGYSSDAIPNYCRDVYCGGSQSYMATSIVYIFEKAN